MFVILTFLSMIHVTLLPGTSFCLIWLATKISSSVGADVYSFRPSSGVRNLRAKALEYIDSKFKLINCFGLTYLLCLIQFI